MTAYYAGIGSRKTPDKTLALITIVARRLEDLGYTVRSGGAQGADQAFGNAIHAKQIFLPWPGFNAISSDYLAPSDAAMALAAQYHPNWSLLNIAARKLHARNCHQILGPDINTPEPVDFVLCWTSDGCEHDKTRTAQTGGTGQAIALASAFNVPVFNLARPNTLERLRDHLKHLGRLDSIERHPIAVDC